MARLELEKTEKIAKKLEDFHNATQKQAITSQSANVNVLLSRVPKIANSLIRDYNELENLQISKRAPAEFIKSARNFCEKKLQEELGKARPGYGFLFNDKPEIVGEDTSHRFVCDVLNGEENFSRSIPFFCISVAIEENKEIINSVIYNPVTDELFYAERGKGAFKSTGRGNIKLKVSNKKAKPVIAVSNTTEAIDGIDCRIFGSSALSLAYVAAGKIDACLINDANPGELAAGLLLIKEAGGTAKPIGGTGTKDKDFVYSTNVFACNDEMTKLLKNKL